MSIGFGIFLIVVGAILTFAVNIDVQAVDLDLIGYILMGAGVVVTLIGIVLLAAARRRSVSSVRVVNDPSTGDRVVRRETTKPPPDVV